MPPPKGNLLALKHGATSPRVIAAGMDEAMAALVEIAPELADIRYQEARLRYLQAALREQLLHQHIVKVSTKEGTAAVPSRMWEQATAASRLAAQLGSDLGLDPIGHARIRALTAGAEVDLARLWAAEAD